MAGPMRAGLHLRCWVGGPASSGLVSDGPRSGPGGINIGVVAFGPKPVGPPAAGGPAGLAGWLGAVAETPLLALIGPGGAALGVIARASEKRCARPA